MTVNWTTITVFISSTFSDMQSERDHLNHFVFPLVKAELKKYAVHLRIIDLRWGVNTLDVSMSESSNAAVELENDAESKVLRVCFDEIDRSKPFFLGLLGERYGSVLSHEKMPEITTRYNVGPDHSITSMEIEYGVLNNSGNLNSIFFERDKNSYANMTEAQLALYDESRSALPETERTLRTLKLNRLKEEIKKTLAERGKPSNYMTYTAEWNGRTFTALEDFGVQVREKLLAEITEYVRDSVAARTGAESERMLQDEFLFEHSKVLAEREALLKDIKRVLLNGSEGIVLTAGSGQGKSGIYTSVVGELKKLPADEYLVLYHSAGVSTSSSKVFGMLRRWLSETARYLNVSPPDVKDVEEARNHLTALLKKIPENVQVVMLVDSIDSFVPEKTSKYLTFFPRYEFRRLSLFATAIPGYETALLDYNHKVKALPLPPVCKGDAAGIIASFFEYYRKELHRDVTTALLAKVGEGGHAHQSPLWLSMALQILMNINEDDFSEAKSLKMTNEEEKIKFFQIKLVGEFPETPQELFRYFLSRMEPVYGSLPEEIFRLLAASFDGLQEEDLRALSGEKWDPVSFALIHSFFKLLLIEQGSEKIWKLAHRQLKDSFALKPGDEAYEKLADYFIEKHEAASSDTRDNMLYYMYFGERYRAALQYITSRDGDSGGISPKILEEALQLLDVVGIDRFIEFLDRITSRDKYPGMGKKHRKLSGFLSVGGLRELARGLTGALTYSGEYEKSLAISLFYVDKIKQGKMVGDLKMLLYVLAANDMVNAAEKIHGDDKMEEVLRQVVGDLKIRGPVSLVLSPISRKYYKWKLFKIIND